MSAEDQEVRRLKRCISALEGCDGPSSNRILTFLQERFKSDPLWQTISEGLIQDVQVSRQLLSEYFEAFPPTNETSGLHKRTKDFLATPPDTKKEELFITNTVRRDNE